ncbi:hydrophobin-319, partial [Macrolepiota fuliginosa MF-IS2]
LALPLFAAATAVPRTDPPAGTITQNNCNVGTLHCCESTQDAKTTDFDSIVGHSGIAALLGPITGTVGLTCSPVSVIGVAGNDCNAQPVCCENNHFNGLVAVGCTPINANL